jgi:hypothetical protein
MPSSKTSSPSSASSNDSANPYKNHNVNADKSVDYGSAYDRKERAPARSSNKCKDATKILNPVTKRCVKKTGAIGKKIQQQQQQQAAVATAAPAPAAKERRAPKKPLTMYDFSHISWRITSPVKDAEYYSDNTQNSPKALSDTIKKAKVFTGLGRKTITVSVIEPLDETAVASLKVSAGTTVSGLLQGIRKAVKGKEDSFGDHTYFEGLYKVEEGVYAVSLGS